MSVKKGVKFFAERCIRVLVTYRWGIVVMNRLYNLLNYKGCSEVHFYFSKIFRESKQVIPKSSWKLNFAGKKIVIPFSSDSFWLDWDTSLSVKGHDVEIKRLYEKMITSAEKPGIFFDIGANYGTHSLLFLRHGVRVISFEPNPTCTAYFRNLLAANNLSGEIQSVALSDVSSGTASLTFAEQDTWLGSLKELQIAERNKIAITVPVSNLDTYCSSSTVYPDLIKIDTEGFELEVLKGGIQTINKSNPIILFESNTTDQRNEVYDLLQECVYDLHELEQSGNLSTEPLTKQLFLQSSRTNFVARKSAR